MLRMLLPVCASLFALSKQGDNEPILIEAKEFLTAK
jgi:hypothetical protein